MSTDAVFQSFDTWYTRFQTLAAERDWPIGTFAERDMWREYFLDGDAPEEALEDDIRVNQ